MPLPSYLDAPVDPAVVSYYHVTGVSYFFLPGNSTPRVVESLPSDPALTQAGKVILSVRPVRGKPGQRIKINLSIENAMGVSGSGMQLRVAYDPAKLQPWAQAHSGGETVLATGLSRNLTFTANGATANGERVITGSSSLEPGTGKLFLCSLRDPFGELEVVDPLKIDRFGRRWSQASRVQGAALRRAVIGPLGTIHSCSASQFVQSFLGHHLLDGLRPKSAFDRARDSTPGSTCLRIWRSGKIC